MRERKRERGDIMIKHRDKADERMEIRKMSEIRDRRGREIPCFLFGEDVVADTDVQIAYQSLCECVSPLHILFTFCLDPLLASLPSYPTSPFFLPLVPLVFVLCFSFSL